MKNLILKLRKNYTKGIILFDIDLENIKNFIIEFIKLNNQNELTEQIKYEIIDILDNLLVDYQCDIFVYDGILYDSGELIELVVDKFKLYDKIL